MHGLETSDRNRIDRSSTENRNRSAIAIRSASYLSKGQSLVKVKDFAKDFQSGVPGAVTFTYNCG